MENNTSNLNKWNEWYKDLSTIEPYGESITYRVGADFLKDCSHIEDWGCGKGWFSQYVDASTNYVGIDGSHNKFVNKHEDLEKYTSKTEGLFMRHVLEHNYNWEKVLNNALQSFTKKMVLIIFTPWSDKETKQIGYTDSVGVPDMSFAKEDIEKNLVNFDYEYLEINSKETFYGIEYVYLITIKNN